MANLIAPPTAKHHGTKLRASEPFIASAKTFQEVLSTTRGLPEEDKAALIDRDEAGALKPVKTTPDAERYKVKLQRQSDIDSAIKTEEREPTRGLGAARLLLSKSAEKRGVPARPLCAHAIQRDLLGVQVVALSFP